MAPDRLFLETKHLGNSPVRHAFISHSSHLDDVLRRDIPKIDLAKIATLLVDEMDERIAAVMVAGNG